MRIHGRVTSPFRGYISLRRRILAGLIRVVNDTADGAGRLRGLGVLAGKGSSETGILIKFSHRVEDCRGETARDTKGEVILRGQNHCAAFNVTPESQSSGRSESLAIRALCTKSEGGGGGAGESERRKGL